MGFVISLISRIIIWIKNKKKPQQHIEISIQINNIYKD